MAKKQKKTNMAPARRADGKKLSRKERKQQKKALRKQQLELEKQLVAEGKIPARNRYRAKSFFGRAVALCLTFLFGIVATVGAFLGFGAFAPAGNVLGLFGVDTSGILHDEYAAQSLMDIVRDVMSNSFDSLESVAKYTPALDTYMNMLADALSDLGVELDQEAVKTTKFRDLGTYFRDEVLNGVVLGKALNVTTLSESNRMIVAICYGNKGEDYTLGTGGDIIPITPPVTFGQLSSDSQSVIERVNVEDAFGITAQSNAAMRFLAYGTEGFNYIVNDADEIEMLTNPLTGEPFRKKTIANLTSDGATPLETARIADLITVEGADGLLGAIKDWTTGDLKYGYRIERLRIDQVMDIDAASSPIARAIGSWRLCDITDPNMMDTLTLGDIIEIDGDSPPILSALGDTQIGELGTAVDGLRLADILGEDDIAGNNFLRSLKFSPLTSLGDGLKKLSAAQVFGETLYSYLDPEENDSQSFSALYEAYKTGRTTKEGSEKIPKAHELAEGETVRSYFEHANDGTHLVHGFYKTVDGGHEVVRESDVHLRKTAGAEEPAPAAYYTTAEQKLEPSYAWRYIDYENAPHVKELPAGDNISSDPAATDGCIVLDADGEALLNGEQPYYYITTRAKFENGTVTAETEKVAYPVMQDGSGIYYTYVKYTPDGGAAEFREVRVDLEREIVSYQYSEGGTDVTLTRNAAGKWSYTPEGAGEVVVTVYTHAAETLPETGEVTVPAYDYFKKEIPVVEGYFEAPADGVAIAGNVYALGDDSVAEKFEIVKTDGTATPVERYLSGVWFFLFGTDGEGNLTDKTDTPVLDLTEAMGKMTDTLSNTVLWQLYFNGLLTSNPFVDLTGKTPGGVLVSVGKTVTNLNECTVAETVYLVQAILGS